VSFRYKIEGYLAGPLQFFIHTPLHDLEKRFIAETVSWPAILQREITVSPRQFTNFKEFAGDFNVATRSALSLRETRSSEKMGRQSSVPGRPGRFYAY